MRNAYPNKSITDLNSPTNNSNGRVTNGVGAIQYWDGTINPITNQPNGFRNFASPITQLTSNEFNQSNYSSGGKIYHIIKLQTDKDDPFGNLFVFSNIVMRQNQNDVLILHREQIPPPLAGQVAPPFVSTTCRILINGTAANTITNIALFQGTTAPTNPQGLANPHYSTDNSGFIWYNNSSAGLTFIPDLSPNSFSNPVLPSPMPLANYPDAFYALTPGVPGLAYGIRDNTPGGVRVPGVGGFGGAPGNSVGGSIAVDGTSIPATVVAAIATQVTLKGNVKVAQVSTNNGLYVRSPNFEDATDRFRAVLYYRVSSSYYEFNTFDSAHPDPQAPFIDYGDKQ